jgi:hypothetical protein
MKPLILTFFAGLLFYSLFIRPSENASATDPTPEERVFFDETQRIQVLDMDSSYLTRHYQNQSYPNTLTGKSIKTYNENDEEKIFGGMDSLIGYPFAPLYSRSAERNEVI